MIAAILCFSLVTGGELLLKEEATVSDRFVRLLEVVDVDRLGVGAREALKNVYLGRSPEAGAERVITAEEIETELRRRGMDLWTITGGVVLVVNRPETEPRMGELSRSSFAFEIKCHLLATRKEMRSDEFTVRVNFIEPETTPAGFEVMEVRTRTVDDLRRGEYRVLLRNAKGEEKVVMVIARVLFFREIPFATRLLRPGHRVHERDFKLRRVEVDYEDRVVEDLERLPDARMIRSVEKGEPITLLDVKLKPTVKRGNVVRIQNRYVETDGRVLEDGGKGEIITVEYLGTKKKVSARVVSPTKVVVVEGGRK